MAGRRDAEQVARCTTRPDSVPADPGAKAPVGTLADSVHGGGRAGRAGCAGQAGREQRPLGALRPLGAASLQPGQRTVTTLLVGGEGSVLYTASVAPPGL